VPSFGLPGKQNFLSFVKNENIKKTFQFENEVKAEIVKGLKCSE